MRGLSKRMRRFAGEYVKDYCAAKAALRAGYAESFAKARASELLQDGRVQLLVRELAGEEKVALEDREGMRFPSMMELAGMLGAMAMTSMADVMSANGEVDRSSAAVRGVRWVKDGEGGLMQEPVLYDRVRAAKEYMKVLAEVAQRGSLETMMDSESWLVHVLGFGWEEKARVKERQVSRTAEDESVRVVVELEDAEVTVTSGATSQGYRHVAKKGGTGRGEERRGAGEERRGAAPDPAGEAHLPRPLDTSCRVPEIGSPDPDKLWGGEEAETRGAGEERRGAAPAPAGEAHLPRPLDTTEVLAEVLSVGGDGDGSSRGSENLSHVVGPVEANSSGNESTRGDGDGSSRGSENPSHIAGPVEANGSGNESTRGDGEGASRGSENPSHIVGPVEANGSGDESTRGDGEGASRGSENPSHVVGPVEANSSGNESTRGDGDGSSRGSENPSHVVGPVEANGSGNESTRGDGDGASRGSENPSDVEGSRGSENHPHVEDKPTEVLAEVLAGKSAEDSFEIVSEDSYGAIASDGSIILRFGPWKGGR